MDRTNITIDRETVRQLRKVQLQLSVEHEESLTLDATVKYLIESWRETRARLASA